MFTPHFTLKSKNKMRNLILHDEMYAKYDFHFHSCQGEMRCVLDRFHKIYFSSYRFMNSVSDHKAQKINIWAAQEM